VGESVEEVERRQDWLAARLRALGAQLHESAREADATAAELEKLADRRDPKGDE
jgi:hypothetical protein